MAEDRNLSAQERAGKAFPVSWDQFHRDCRALTWRLNEVGPFHAVIAITRGGLVPAAIVARELGMRVIDTVCIASYDHTKQGELQVLKGISEATAKLGGGTGKGLLIVDDLVDTGKTGRMVREMMPDAHFATVYAKPKGTAAGRYLHHRSIAGHLDPFSLGYRAVVPAADPSVTARRNVVVIRGRDARSVDLRQCKYVESFAHSGVSDRFTAPLPAMTTRDGIANAPAKPRHANGRHRRHPHRGLFTGNRGIIHDPATKTLLKKRWSGPAWITCVCEFRGRRRKVMATRSWTELFFLDEATAFAAGHRPCFFCRRDDANRFRAAWEAGNGVEDGSRAGNRHGAASRAAGPRQEAAASVADAARTAARGRDAAGRR